MEYIGKSGTLRIFDSTKGRDLSQTGPKEVHIANQVVAAHNDITANMLNPSSGTNTILAVNTDRVYVGQLFPFSKIDIDLTGLASADGGALVCEYWNGSTWVSVANLIDGTAVGGNTMRQDGAIQFDVPTDWVVNDVPVTGTNLYYVRFRTTNSTATDAIAQLIEPSSGQYFEVAFVNMDFKSPMGRPRPEEMVRMNRGKLDTNAHYVQGLDDPSVEPVDLSFSAMLDSLVNKTALFQALACGNPATTTWAKTGISTKTDSQVPAGLDGALVNTPPFTDTSKKAVCIQVMWEAGAVTLREFHECNEVYVRPEDISISEAPDGVMVNVTGAIYGSIRSDLSRFGYRL
jgi:hypothetical protein